MIAHPRVMACPNEEEVVMKDIELTDLARITADEFVRYFRHLASRVERAAMAVPEDRLWIKPFPFGNSIGHLVLHLTGNLNHYIGALIADTGYIRHREHEFTDAEKHPRGELLSAFQSAVDMVVRTLERKTPSHSRRRSSNNRPSRPDSVSSLSVRRI